MIIQIIAGIGIAGYLVALTLFVVEAWQESPTQAVLCVVLPFYLVYYAFIKSQRERPYRLVLMGSIFCFFLLPVVAGLIQQLGSGHG